MLFKSPEIIYFEIIFETLISYFMTLYITFTWVLATVHKYYWINKSILCGLQLNGKESKWKGQLRFLVLGPSPLCWVLVYNQLSWSGKHLLYLNLMLLLIFCIFLSHTWDTFLCPKCPSLIRSQFTIADWVKVPRPNSRLNSQGPM